MMINGWPRPRVSAGFDAGLRGLWTGGGALLALCAGLTACSPAPKTAEGGACEAGRPVVFGGLDWDSNAFHTEVARFILKAAFDCGSEVIPGSTIPLNAGLVRGDIDVLMEVWSNSAPEVWVKGVASGRVRAVGVNFPDAVQGIYVPRYVIEGDRARGIAPMAPGLKSVADLPGFATVFQDPEEPGKGRFYNCVLGWACEVTNTKKLEAYGLNATFTNFRPGTGAALDAAIVGAIKKGEPILAYYWSPTWLMGAYDLVQLEEPEFDPAVWASLQSTDHPDKAVAYPLDEVEIGVNTGFAKKAPGLIAFLSAYRTSAAVVSDALAYVAGDPSQTSADAARHFLKTRPDVWTPWLTQEQAAKVKAALNAAQPAREGGP